MLRIGICDDQLNARDALRFELEKILRDKSEQIVYEFSTGASAVRWLEKHPGEIDLLFLDVEMDGISGMDAAAQIRNFDKEICLVFVTGYTDYVFDGYKVNALDYVIKPASAKKLLDVLKRVREQLSDKYDKTFSFKNPEGTYRLPLSNIAYFYSDKRKVNIVCTSRERSLSYSFYGKLDEVEAKLSHAFVRIHQRYLVNPAHVERIGSENITIAGACLPMSRALKESAAVKLAKAMLEVELS
ncbi:MAG: response regulator transcription factor [Lachnospiraceae bacterium]|nr:response regulator transcription factor [Lachnospiraceae bacterium]